MIYLLKVFCVTEGQLASILVLVIQIIGQIEYQDCPLLSPIVKENRRRGIKKGEEGPILSTLGGYQNQAGKALSCADSHSECQGTQRLREVVYHFIQSSPHFEVEFEE